MFCLKIGPLDFKTNHLDPFVLPFYTPLSEQLWWVAPRQEWNSGLSTVWQNWSWRRPIALRASSIPIPYAYNPTAVPKERFLDSKHGLCFLLGGGGARKHTRKIGHPAEWPLHPSSHPSLSWKPCDGSNNAQIVNFAMDQHRADRTFHFEGHENLQGPSCFDMHQGSLRGPWLPRCIPAKLSCSLVDATLSSDHRDLVWNQLLAELGKICWKLMKHSSIAEPR